jgi:hypothetical protein
VVVPDPEPKIASTMTERPAIVCDMTDAPDTGQERLAEYARLFAAAYLGKEWRGAEMRWRFRADPGIEAWARDLAARENACCGFMQTTITVQGDEVIWDTSTIDDPNAHRVLELMYELPDSMGMA